MDPFFLIHLHSFAVFFLTHLTLSTIATTPEDINSSALKSQIIHQIFKASQYDNKLRPTGTNDSKGPVEISLQLHLKSIQNFDDVLMQFTIQAVFRQEWVDPRLSYSNLKPNISFIYLYPTDTPIWVPDIFFTNEKAGHMHNLVTPNIIKRIYPSGKVFHSCRLTLTLSCPMDLRYFPFDEHPCPIKMQSYGWSSKDLVLKWQPKNPIVMPKAVVLPKFKVVEHTFERGCFTAHRDGNFSCAKVEILFDRQYSLYLIQFYIPSTLLCIISWIGVFLDPHEVEARVSLGITTSLSAVVLSFVLNQIAPATSYVRVIDVWLLFCQGMVISVLVEFTLVNYFTTHVVNSQINEFIVPHVELVGYEQWKLHQESKFLARATHKAFLVDKVARFLYPFVFITFASTYWLGFIFLLHHLHQQN